jgi:hypothetical protein
MALQSLEKELEYLIAIKRAESANAQADEDFFTVLKCFNYCYYKERHLIECLTMKKEHTV